MILIFFYIACALDGYDVVQKDFTMASFSVIISKVKESVGDLSNLNRQFDNFRDAFSYFGDICEKENIDYEFKGETTTIAGGAGYLYAVSLVVEGVEEFLDEQIFLCGC